MEIRSLTISNGSKHHGLCFLDYRMEDMMDSRLMRLFGIVFLLFQSPGLAIAEQTESSSSPGSLGGLYVSFDFSVGSPNDPEASGVYEADLGLELGTRLGIGYSFDGLRAEAQLGYQSFTLNNVNPVPGSPITEFDSSGDLAGLVMMANLFYDFGVPGGARPFLGAGIGFANLEADYHGLVCFILCSEGAQIVDGSDTVGAWQGMAGLSTPLRSGHGEWFIGYRYFGTDDIGLNVVGVGPVTQEGVQSHSVMLGWRFRLQSY
jgi:opacity protein-like surface antigen